MTVQELIDTLQKLDNKSLKVRYNIERQTFVFSKTRLVSHEQVIAVPTKDLSYLPIAITIDAIKDTYILLS